MLVLVRSLSDLFMLVLVRSLSDLFMLVLVRSLSDLFMLVLVRSFSYIPFATFTDELYTPDDSFSEEFLLHS